MDVSLRVRIVRATKRNGREVLNRVKCVRHLLHSSTELRYTTYRLPTWLVSICGFYSLARSHQTVPKPRTTWNELCQKSKLLTDLPCRLHLKSFLNLEFLQGQVRYSLRNKKQKGGGGHLPIITLRFLCNVLPSTASDQVSGGIPGEHQLYCASKS